MDLHVYRFSRLANSLTPLPRPNTSTLTLLHPNNPTYTQEYKANYFMVARYILKDSIALTAVGAFSAIMGFAIT